MVKCTEMELNILSNEADELLDECVNLSIDINLNESVMDTVKEKLSTTKDTVLEYIGKLKKWLKEMFDKMMKFIIDQKVKIKAKFSKKDKKEDKKEESNDDKEEEEDDSDTIDVEVEDVKDENKQVKTRKNIANAHVEFAKILKTFEGFIEILMKEYGNKDNVSGSEIKRTFLTKNGMNKSENDLSKAILTKCLGEETVMTLKEAKYEEIVKMFNDNTLVSMLTKAYEVCKRSLDILEKQVNASAAPDRGKALKVLKVIANSTGEINNSLVKTVGVIQNEYSKIVIAAQ